MGRGAEKEKLAIQLRYISRGQKRKEGVPDFASFFKEGILGNAVCRPYLLQSLGISPGEVDQEELQL